MNNEQPKSEAELRVERNKEIILLATELNGKVFTFSPEDMEGDLVNPEAYSRIKAADEEYPGFTTPIDTIIARYKKEGIKVVLGKNPESGNVFILPGESNNVEEDSLPPKSLEGVSGLPDNLKELILKDRARYPTETF